MSCPSWSALPRRTMTCLLCGHPHSHPPRDGRTRRITVAERQGVTLEPCKC